MTFTIKNTTGEPLVIQIEPWGVLDTLVPEKEYDLAVSSNSGVEIEVHDGKIVLHYGPGSVIE